MAQHRGARELRENGDARNRDAQNNLARAFHTRENKDGGARRAGVLQFSSSGRTP